MGEDAGEVAHDAAGEADVLPASRRRGIGVCLSGGGFRATLFHAGALLRLSELGLVARDDFSTVASVSGGSITAAQWAVALAQTALQGKALSFRDDVVRPLEALTSRDLRTGALARKFFLPWNWFRGAYAVDAMIDRFEALFGKGTLDLLPDAPRFVFCATDMSFGASFVFGRERVGSYLAGYASPRDFTLAQAVAASACFPPLFGPMRIRDAATRFKGGAFRDDTTRRAAFADLRVTDGGVYDNLGLEPVWKSHRVVFACDAGGLMDPEADRNWIWRIARYQAIQETQARAVRKRFLLSGYANGTLTGAYVGVGSAVSSYDTSTPVTGDARGYSKDFATRVIRNIRTDLDGFGEAERGVLLNHGYSLIDTAVRKHTPELIGEGAVAFAWPAKAVAPGTIREDQLIRLLAGSERRRLTGRG